jgi:hypothetical protein
MMRGVPPIEVIRPKAPELKFVWVLSAFISVGGPQLNVFNRLNALHAQLQRPPRAERNETRQRRVDRSVAGRSDAVATEVAERTWRRQRERGGVQPVIDGLVSVRIRKHLIDALILNAAERAVLTRDDVDWLARPAR